MRLLHQDDDRTLSLKYGSYLSPLSLSLCVCVSVCASADCPATPTAPRPRRPRPPPRGARAPPARRGGDPRSRLRDTRDRRASDESLVTLVYMPCAAPPPAPRSPVSRAWCVCSLAVRSIPVSAGVRGV